MGDLPIICQKTRRHYKTCSLVTVVNIRNLQLSNPRLGTNGLGGGESGLQPPIFFLVRGMEALSGRDRL